MVAILDEKALRWFYREACGQIQVTQLRRTQLRGFHMYVCGGLVKSVKEFVRKHRVARKAGCVGAIVSDIM